MLISQSVRDFLTSALVGWTDFPPRSSVEELLEYPNLSRSSVFSKCYFEFIQSVPVTIAWQLFSLDSESLVVPFIGPNAVFFLSGESALGQHSGQGGVLGPSANGTTFAGSRLGGAIARAPRLSGTSRRRPHKGL